MIVCPNCKHESKQKILLFEVDPQKSSYKAILPSLVKINIQDLQDNISFEDKYIKITTDKNPMLIEKFYPSNTELLMSYLAQSKEK